MKNLLTIGLVSIAAITGQSQAGQKEEPLLTAYYSVKDALVNGDQKLAAANANNLVKELGAYTSAKLDKKGIQLKEKIKSDAAKIAKTNELVGQRETFQTLSVNFFELAKLMDLSPSPVYQFYCPMKQAIWLSSENSVRNPYYGKQMLTCGSLQETLK